MTGSITLEVVFGSPDNFRSEVLIFDIVPFRSVYHALLGRTAFARFNAVPHYAYLKLKMPGPHGVITVTGSTKHSLRTEEYTTTLVAEARSDLFKPNSSSVLKIVDGVHLRVKAQINLRMHSRPVPIDRPIRRLYIFSCIHKYTLKIPSVALGAPCTQEVHSSARSYSDSRSNSSRIFSPGSFSFTDRPS